MSAWARNRARLVWWAFGAALAVVLAYVVGTYVGTFVFGLFISTRRGPSTAA